MYSVIGKRCNEEIVIEPSMSFEQALKMCEEWGWAYDDGHHRYTMYVIKN